MKSTKEKFIEDNLKIEDPLFETINMSMEVEIARSFSYKLAMEGYENRDFFCSAKRVTDIKHREQVSKELYEFCRDEVLKSVRDYKQEILKQKTEKSRHIEQKDRAKDEIEHDYE